MRKLNTIGLARAFIPKVTVEPYTTGTLGKHDGSYSSTLLIMSNDRPSVDELSIINNKEDIINAYSPYILHEANNIVLSFNYDLFSKTMSVQKTPVDAIELPFLTNGNIQWAAIIFNVTGTNKPILFLELENIGLWGEHNKSIIVDVLSGSTNDFNIIKDISFKVSDNFNI